MAQILFKRGNSASITSIELAAGEPAVALDTGKVYIGDGEKKILVNPDHVPSSQKAESLKTARSFNIAGDVTAEAVEFNGTGNVTLNATLPKSGVQAGTHVKVTVNDKGVVTGAAQLAESDIPALAATKITETEEKKFVTKEEKEKISNVDQLIQEGDTFHTQEGVTINGLGGIKPGEELNGLTVEQVLSKLLYPHIPPVVKATSTPKDGGTFELGTTQTVTGISVNVTKKSATIKKIEVFDGAQSLASKTDGDIANGGTFQFEINKEVTTNKSFKVEVTDSKDQKVTVNTGEFVFVDPIYFGVCDDDAVVNEELIKTLTKKVTVPDKNELYSYTCNDQRAIIAYPKSRGDLQQILDPNSFDVTRTFVKQVISINGASGVPVEYNVYVSGAATVSEFAYRFKY